MAAVVRVLEDLDARQVLVEALAVPARRMRFSRTATDTKRGTSRRRHVVDATETTRSQPPQATPSYAIEDKDAAKHRLKYMNSPCLFCTFSTSPESLNQLISSPYSPWAYSSAERQPAH